ncbi:MAG: hypothetical protein ACPGJS_13025 [Flammeovirgaceae bacterium]
MTKTKIFTLLMVPVVVVLGYLLFQSINSKIVEAENIKKSEANVIKRLKMIREAEKAFKAANGGLYTSSFDSLIDFVKNGQLYITEKKEIITPRKRDDPDYYKGDIITIQIDTIGVESVATKLFPKEEYPNFNPDELSTIPGTDKKFELYAGTIQTKSGVDIAVLEVVDRHPLDKTRTEDHPSRKRWPLRFGSRTDATLSGNWE